MTKLVRRLGGWLIPPFMAGSAIGATIGIYTVDAENIPVFLLSMGIAIAVGVLLQVLIFWLWELVVLPEAKRWIRVLALVLGIGTSATSGLLGGGTFTLIWNRKALADYSTEQNAKSISDPVSAFSDKLLATAAAFDLIQQDASDKQTPEQNFGATCDGVRTGPGAKQRFRLRDREAEKSKELARLSRKLAGQATDILEVLKQNDSAEGMAKALQSARLLLSGADFSSIKSWLQGEIEGFDGEFLDPDTGTRFVCHDSQLEKKMKAALTAITRDESGKSGFELPAVPPQPANIDLKDTIERSFSDAFALTGMFITGKIDSRRYAEVAYIIPGYMLAFTIEIILVALICADAVIRRAEGRYFTRPDVFNLKRRNLPPELKERYLRYVPKLMGLLYEDRNQVFFARPLDGDHRIAALCLEISMNLQLPNDPDMKPNVPLADIDPEWVRARNAVHGGARRFAMHPLNPAILEWLRLAVSDLIEFSLPDSETEESSESSADEDDSAAEPRRSPVLKINADANGNFYAVAEIDGNVPVKVMIDTGASSVALSYADAERMNLNPAALNYNVTVHTANGTTLKARVVLGSIRLASIALEKVDALVSLPGALDCSLLGMSFLARTSFAVNGSAMVFYE